MQEPYIYLDWNVIKYIKTSDKDNKFESSLEWLEARYKFPFSFAHLCDLQRSEESYVNDDLVFLNKISNGYMIDIDDDINQYDIARQNVFEKYSEVKDSKDKIYPNIKIDDVIREKILNDGFEAFFSNVQNAVLLYPVTLAALSRFDSDYELYEEFRKYMLQQGKKPEKNFLSILSKDSFSEQDVEMILEEFKKFEGGNNLSKSKQMKSMYMLLEFKNTFNGKRIKDRINRKNNFTNIYTDAMHMGLAQFAECYVTNDEITRRKTELVYQSFGIKTKVVDINGFLERIAKEL